MRIFVSSSFQDLQEYRLAAIRVLRQLGHEVVAMEDFVAASAVPLEFVLAKMDKCDLFIGLFAWRYGYIPTKNPNAKKHSSIPKVGGATYGSTSITHYEYLYAKQKEIDRLAFLLAESVPWPPHLIDGFSTLDPDKPKDAQAIRKLRSELQQEGIVSFFLNPNDLEARVSAAVTVAGMSLQVSLNLADIGQVSDTINDSGTDPDQGIRSAILAADQKRVLKLNLLPNNTWWSTRLYLTSLLAEHLTNVRRILVATDKKFVGLLPTRWIMAVLETKHPILPKIKKKFEKRSTKYHDVNKELEALIELWNTSFAAGGNSRMEEEASKIILSPTLLRQWFQDTMLHQPVRISDLSRATEIDLLRILDYPSEFVPVVTEQPMKGENGPTTSDNTSAFIKVVDKSALNAKLAQSYVSEL